MSVPGGEASWVHLKLLGCREMEGLVSRLDKHPPASQQGVEGNESRETLWGLWQGQRERRMWGWRQRG